MGTERQRDRDGETSGNRQIWVKAEGEREKDIRKQYTEQKHLGLIRYKAGYYRYVEVFMQSHQQQQHQCLNREGPRGTTDDFTTSFLLFSLFSTALWDLANSRPVHSIFFCLPCLLLPFTLPCKMVLARPDEQETCPCSAVCIALQWSGGLCVVQ